MEVKIKDDLYGMMIESPIVCEMTETIIGEDGKRYLNYYGKAKLTNGDVVEITIKRIKLDITQINFDASEYREWPRGLFDEPYSHCGKVICYIPFTISDEIIVERYKNNN